MSLTFTSLNNLLSCTCLLLFLFISYTVTLQPLGPSVSAPSHFILSLMFVLSHSHPAFYFSHKHTYLSAATTDVSANINETRHVESPLIRGNGRKRGGVDLGRKKKDAVFVDARSLGSYLTLSGLHQSRYCPKTFPSCFAFTLGEVHEYIHTDINEYTEFKK